MRPSAFCLRLLRSAVSIILVASLVVFSSAVNAQSSTSNGGSSSASASNSATGRVSASSSADATTSGNATVTARPVTTTYVTYSLSGTRNQTVSYTTTQVINSTSPTGSAGSGGDASSSYTPTTLPIISTTLSYGDAGSNPTVTAPDPGSSGTNQGPGDNYRSAALPAVIFSVGSAVTVAAVSSIWSVL